MATLAGIAAQDSASDDAGGSSADAFYQQLFAVRDAVVAGNHAKIVLPAGAVERLKTSLRDFDGVFSYEDEPERLAPRVQSDGSVQTNTALPSASVQADLPGFGSPVGTKVVDPFNAKTASSGLDPIFLEKSDSLVKAEGRLKRQRIEKDLATQSDNIAQVAHDGASGRLDVDALLAAAQERFPHVSATEPQPAIEVASVASSFDENDYYSSLVESEWSPDAPSAKGSDRHIGSFMADFEPLQVVASASKTAARTNGKVVVPSKPLAINSVDSSPASSRAPSRAQEINGIDEADDEDEEYSPPEPIIQNGMRGVRKASVNMLEDGEEEESDYEPGEIAQVVANGSQASNGVHPALHYQEAPTYRSHLTHIAAPQPNRVSPLAVQKGPNVELELVNGRPEIVHKQTTRRGYPIQSRASSTSPPATRNGPAPIGKRKSARLNKQVPTEPKGKKRKRTNEQQNNNTARKRQERYRAQSPPSPNTQAPANREPYIKPEPISPPGISDVPVPPEYTGRLSNAQQPIEIDLDSPRQYIPREQYAYAPPAPYGYAPQPPQPVEYRAASSGGYRTVQRDTQDLRRVASLHHTQRPVSPPKNVYSPVAPYHAASQGHMDIRQPSMAPPAALPRYVEQPPVDSYQAPLQAVRAQSYRESSPAFMAPPAARSRQIVVDQYGRQFYAAEPVVPLAFQPVYQPEPEPYYERTQSRMSTMPPPQPKQQVYYESDDQRMAPPSQPLRRQYQPEAPVEYMDTNGYRVREHTAQPPQYAAAPTSPVYQSMPQYEPMAAPPPVRQVYREDQYQHMPPPQAPAPPSQPTSPVYAAPPRAYSVRPEAYEPAPAPQYMPRQASVAPVQYAPSRAASIMPGSEYGVPAYQQQQQQQRAPSYAMQPPAPVRYVDEYGRELVQQDVRQGSQFR
ncbi:hypothetical protein B0A48_16216 [Cryoendolithus antarcticus]|uniref:Uncharacterized protein n=1 Tax=Cryoendolithus antarcticus TaxID=1507870 RepID=A0A1V8SFJ4_9PEZI|nr:hypothetical protein B0A48_16216 [Cryoendolithus antarcticus]